MSDLIALLAMLASLFALWQTHKIAARSDRLTEQEIELIRQQLASNRQLAIEEKLANVSARMFKDGKTWRVRVFNAGPSEARNVRLLLTDSNYLVCQNAIHGKFPMERMEKGQSVDFWAIVTQSSPNKESLTIQWDDSSGLNRKNTVEITI